MTCFLQKRFHLANYKNVRSFELNNKLPLSVKRAGDGMLEVWLPKKAFFNLSVNVSNCS